MAVNFMVQCISFVSGVDHQEEVSAMNYQVLLIPILQRFCMQTLTSLISANGKVNINHNVMLLIVNFDGYPNPVNMTLSPPGPSIVGGTVLLMYSVTLIDPIPLTSDVPCSYI